MQKDAHNAVHVQAEPQRTAGFTSKQLEGMVICVYKDKKALHLKSVYRTAHINNGYLFFMVFILSAQKDHQTEIISLDGWKDSSIFTGQWTFIMFELCQENKTRCK